MIRIARQGRNSRIFAIRSPTLPVEGTIGSGYHVDFVATRTRPFALYRSSIVKFKYEKGHTAQHSRQKHDGPRSEISPSFFLTAIWPSDRAESTPTAPVSVTGTEWKVEEGMAEVQLQSAAVCKEVQCVVCNARIICNPTGGPRGETAVAQR